MTGETAAELRARLGALAEAATAGPWVDDDEGNLYVADPLLISEWLPVGEASPGDAALIVALVNAWPAIDALLARLAAAEADADRGWYWVDLMDDDEGAEVYGAIDEDRDTHRKLVRERS